MAVSVSVPVSTARVLAGLAGALVVISASLFASDPLFRMLAVWVGFVPLFRALHWQASPAASAVGRGGEMSRGAPGIDVQKFAALGGGPSPKRVDGTKVASSPGTERAPAAPPPPPAHSATAPTSPPSPPSPSSARSPGVVGRPPSGSRAALPSSRMRPGTSYVNTRRYLRLRRLTEQYLREVRRMNLVAVWGRQGAISRRQALDEIREIEDRMQNLTGRMKMEAGKVGS